MHWISVADKLPTPGEKVMVNVKDEINRMLIVNVASCGDAICFEIAPFIAIGNVTHWRPLPKPPTI